MYHGDRARYHYFQCLQLVLRCQIKSLIELWRLPPEFEVRPRSLPRGCLINSSQIVCRDVWALHLGTIPHAISPEPHLHREDGEGEAPIPIKRLPGPSQSDQSQDSKSGGSDSESIGSTPSEEGEDPELEALLAQLSASSEDDDPAPPSAPIEEAHPTRKAWGVYELPANNIAVLILACWTLRIPVTFQDFTKWVFRRDLRISGPNLKS